MANIEIEEFLKDCLDVIGQAHKFISARRGSFQLKSDIDSGYIRKSGILLDAKTQIRRFTFENYDLFVLRGYIILAGNVLNNAGNPFTQFSLRVLHEIGVQKINVLFAQGISEDSRNRFKLENTLSDWLELSSQSPYREDFPYLFTEEQGRLDDHMRKLFKKADEALRSNQKVQSSLIKNIRNDLNRNIKEYAKDIEPLPFLNKSDFATLNIAWSHLLHGNPFHIEAVFNQVDFDSMKNRTYAILCQTAINVLYRINGQVEDPSLRETMGFFLNRADLVWDKIVTDWKRSKISKKENLKSI